MDGLEISIVEAMAAEKPAATTNIGGVILSRQKLPSSVMKRFFKNIFIHYLYA